MKRLLCLIFGCRRDVHITAEIPVRGCSRCKRTYGLFRGAGGDDWIEMGFKVP